MRWMFRQRPPRRLLWLPRWSVSGEERTLRGRGRNDANDPKLTLTTLYQGRSLLEPHLRFINQEIQNSSIEFIWLLQIREVSAPASS